jgi:predicted Zn-dependent peptidase
MIAQNGNSVKEEERMNQLFCETTEELFCEITENLELTQKNKELFRIFLHSLDTEEMRIFILNRLFVRRIAQNETTTQKGG